MRAEEIGLGPPRDLVGVDCGNFDAGSAGSVESVVDSAAKFNPLLAVGCDDRDVHRCQRLCVGSASDKQSRE